MISYGKLVIDYEKINHFFLRYQCIQICNSGKILCFKCTILQNFPVGMATNFAPVTKFASHLCHSPDVLCKCILVPLSLTFITHILINYQWASISTHIWSLIMNCPLTPISSLMHACHTNCIWLECPADRIIALHWYWLECPIDLSASLITPECMHAEIDISINTGSWLIAALCPIADLSLFYLSCYFCIYYLHSLGNTQFSVKWVNYIAV